VDETDKKIRNKTGHHFLFLDIYEKTKMSNFEIGKKEFSEKMSCH
jgi:hypothetical protein